MLFRSVGEGFPVVLSVVATEAGNAPGAHPGRGKPGLRGWKSSDIYRRENRIMALHGAIFHLQQLSA